MVTAAFGILYNDILWLFDISTVNPSSFMLVIFMNIFATYKTVEDTHKLWSILCV